MLSTDSIGYMGRDELWGDQTGVWQEAGSSYIIQVGDGYSSGTA